MESQLRDNPQAHPGLRIGVASAALAGRMELAHSMAARLKQTDPGFGVAGLPRTIWGLTRSLIWRSSSRACDGGVARMTQQRRLAAILVADVVGYSKLIGSDEVGTLAQLQALRTESLSPNSPSTLGGCSSRSEMRLPDRVRQRGAGGELRQAIQEANGRGVCRCASVSMSAMSSCRATICWVTG